MEKENRPIMDTSASYLRVELNTLAENGLRLAIPPRGELAQGSIDYLNAQGWDTSLLAPETRKLTVEVAPNVSVFKLRADDAVTALRKGAIDIAILGADVIAEARLDKDNPADFIQFNPLGFGACSFRMAFPFARTPFEPEDLSYYLVEKNMKIATSLPNLLIAILKEQKCMIDRNDLLVMTGSVESALDLYQYSVFAIADRVSSGQTMLLNHLRPDWALWESPGAYLTTRRDFFERNIYKKPESRYFSFT